MIRIAFDVDDRRRDVARSIAERVDDDAAADRAVRAGRSRLGGARDLQLAHLRQRRREVEAQHRHGDAANGCSLEKVPAAGIHGRSARGSDGKLNPMEIARERFLDDSRAFHLTIGIRSRTTAAHSLLSAL